MRIIILILGLAALLYAALAAYIWIFQSRFVYFPDEPGRSLDLTPRDIGLDYSDVRFTASDGVSLHGWFVPGGDGPVILYFHGNAGNISHRLESIRFLHELGVSVFIIDYRGYGRSAGKPDEAGTYRDALGAWSYLTRERGLDPDRIVLFGRSLGGAIAAWLANEVPVRALVLSSTFSSIPDMARIAFPFMPAGLARIRYDTESLMSTIACPVLLMHSRDDEIIPYALGQKLLAAAPAQTTFVSLQGGHNDVHHALDRSYELAIRRFLVQHAGMDFQATPSVLQ